LLKPPSAANAGQEHAIKKENAIVIVMPAPAVSDRRQPLQINRLFSDFTAIDIIIWAPDYCFGTTMFSFVTEMSAHHYPQFGKLAHTDGPLPMGSRIWARKRG
jgi:hypothetical protein